MREMTARFNSRCLGCDRGIRSTPTWSSTTAGAVRS